MKFFHAGFEHLRDDWPYDILIRCHQCNKERPMSTHGYCKRWKIRIMGRRFFMLDTKRHYRLCCDKCGTPRNALTKLRFRDMQCNRHIIALYSPLIGFPFLWFVNSIFRSDAFVVVLFLVWLVGTIIFCTETVSSKLRY